MHCLAESVTVLEELKHKSGQRRRSVYSESAPRLPSLVLPYCHCDAVQA